MSTAHQRSRQVRVSSSSTITSGSCQQLINDHVRYVSAAHQRSRQVRVSSSSTITSEVRVSSSSTITSGTCQQLTITSGTCQQLINDHVRFVSAADDHVRFVSAAHQRHRQVCVSSSSTILSKQAMQRTRFRRLTSMAVIWCCSPCVPLAP